MGVLFEVLQLTCVVLFTLLIPLMVRKRFRNPEFPTWQMILLAIALGWIFPCAHKTLERPMHQAFDREEWLAAEEYMRHPPPPIENAAGETVVENPFGVGDWIAEDYHPIESPACTGHLPDLQQSWDWHARCDHCREHGAGLHRANGTAAITCAWYDEHFHQCPGVQSA